MQPLLAFVLFGGFAVGQIVNCNSFGIPDGYQGHDKWRASTKDCADATNKLEDSFGQIIPQAIQGCLSLATAGDCEVSVCDSQNVRRAISYEAVWTAARIVHARHKEGGNVAGYVSIDDYADADGFKVFIKVARKDTPDPQNKRRRSLFGRRSVLDEVEARSEPPSAEATVNGTEAAEGMLLEARDERHWWNRDIRYVPGTNGLYTNIRAGWGAREEMPEDQMQNGMDNLLREWNGATGSPSSLRPPAYMAPGENMIEFEWAAHNNHNIGAVSEEERSALLYWAIQERQEQGDHWENFAMQIRRGGESVGHLIIRVFWAGLQDALANVCG